MNVDLDGDAQLLPLAVLGQCNYSRVCSLALGTRSEAWERHSWNNSSVSGSHSGAPGPLRGQGLCDSVVRLVIALPVPASQVWDTPLMAGREWLEGHTQLGGKVWLDYFPSCSSQFHLLSEPRSSLEVGRAGPCGLCLQGSGVQGTVCLTHPHPLKIPNGICHPWCSGGCLKVCVASCLVST